MISRSNCIQAVSSAQGTIEYLVIIAIVVVLSLVVAGLVLSQTQSGDNVSSTASEISAKTSLISITNASFNPTDGNYFLGIRNNDPDVTQINTVSVGTDSNFFNEQLPLSAEKVFKVPTTKICTSGQKTSENVTISYTTKYGLTKTQSFANRSISCEVISVDATKLAGYTAPAPIVGVSDITPPVVSLLGPDDNNIVTYFDHNVVFSFSVDETVVDCNLYITNTLVDRNSSLVSANTVVSLDANLVAFGTGDHYWDVNCLDTNNNKGTAVDRNINYTAPVVYISLPRNVYFSTASDFNFGSYFLNSAVINPPIKPMGELDWNASDRGAEFSLSSPFNDSNLLGLWHLNSNANDSKGSVNGSWVGTSSYPIGLWGGIAAGFSSGNYISFTASTATDIATIGTINLWMKQTTNTGGYQTLISKRSWNDASTVNYEIGLEPTTNKLYFYNGVSATAIGTAMDSSWHMLTVVSSTTLGTDFYLDGLFFAHSTVNLSPATNRPLYFGNIFAGNQQFTGLIDDIAIWNRGFSAIEISSLYKSYKGNWVDNNLVAYYKLNSKSGTTIFDSARGNSGTLATGADINAQGLWDTNALYLNGSTGYVTLPNNSMFDMGAGPRTITAWINPTSVSSLRGIYIRGANPGYAFRINGGYLEYFKSAGGSYSMWTSPRLVSSGKWHYVSVVDYGNGTCDITLDSVKDTIVQTNYNSDLPYSGWNFIGGYYSGGLLQGFVGTIEELKIYNRALTAPEIALDFNRGLMDSNYISRIVDTSPASVATDYNYLVLNTNNGLDKNGLIYGTQIEPTVEKDLNVGLVGLWHLNEASGATAIDSSVYANNGIYVNSPAVATGLWGANARTFNGSSNYSYALNSSSLDPTQLTLSAWFKTSQISAGGAIVNKGKGLGQSYGLFVNDLSYGVGGVANKINYGHYNGSWKIVSSITTINDNKWHNVIVTDDQSQMRLYLDGVLESTVASTTRDYSTPGYLMFGAYWVNNSTFSNYYSGQTDEVAIWNRALDANLIKELFNKGASRIGAKYRGCVDSTCSTNPSWSALTYTDSNSKINLDTIDGNQFMQYSLYPTLYTFPDGNVFPQAFASIRDVNVVYTN